MMGASRNTPPNCGPPGSGRMPHGPRRGRQQAAWRPGASAISANATEQSPRVIYTARGHMGDQRTVLVAACYSHRGFPGSSTFIFGPCLFSEAGSALFLLCVSIGVPSVCVRGVWVGAFCAGKTRPPAPYAAQFQLRNCSNARIAFLNAMQLPAPQTVNAVVSNVSSETLLNS